MIITEGQKQQCSPKCLVLPAVRCIGLLAIRHAFVATAVTNKLVLGDTVECSPECRGFCFAAPVAVALKVPFIPLRKPGKLPSKSIGVDFKQSAGKGAAYFGKVSQIRLPERMRTHARTHTHAFGEKQARPICREYVVALTEDGCICPKRNEAKGDQPGMYRLLQFVPDGSVLGRRVGGG